MNSRPDFLDAPAANTYAAPSSPAMQLESRRHFLKSAGALMLALGHPGVLRAAVGLPIADAHSHIGMFSSQLSGRSLKAQMEESGLTLLSWNIVGDVRWTKRTSYGIEQKSVPADGAQASHFRERLDKMRRYLASIGLDFVKNAADVDAARSGAPHVVIAVEGAGFAADSLELLDQSYAEGLRHLQLVHYIRNALGDLQTERPEHGGLTELGIKVIKSCNRLGILVDLAHCTNASIDQALESSSVPMIWSHSAITTAQYSWRQSSNLSRLLRIDYARKIARQGGAVGLWALRSTVGNGPGGYATELLRMVDELGPDHVMFGTDTDGMGRYGATEQLADVRKVADSLQERGVDDRTLRAICFDNYARCLKGAMQASANATTSSSTLRQRTGTDFSVSSRPVEQFAQRLTGEKLPRVVGE